MIYKKKKNQLTGGLIIRLIDVVLILLFGFIAISEISRRSQIQLARSEAVPATAPDREQVLYIGVLPDGRYLVEDERNIISDVTALDQYVRSKQQYFSGRDTRMRVRVRANHDAAVRDAFVVVNVCQDAHIPVGLDVIRKGR